MATASRIATPPTTPPDSILLDLTEFEATAVRVLLGGHMNGTDSEIGKAISRVWIALMQVTKTDRYSNCVFEFDGGFRVKEGATL